MFGLFGGSSWIWLLLLGFGAFWLFQGGDFTLPTA
jgi:hypothetical protein